MANFDIAREGKTATIALDAPLTASVVKEMQTAMKELLSEEVEVLVVDLARVSMIDSSGIGLLIAASNSLARTGGKISVVNVSKEIANLLSSMRLVSRLNVKQAS